MTSPDTIHETIAMLRRRKLEIDRLIERLERERNSLRAAPKRALGNHRARAAR